MAQNIVDQTSLTGKSQVPPQPSNSTRIWRFVAPKLVGVFNFTVIVTVAGFFVLQSYLASFSKLFTFKISITQYIAAGVNLILAILWNLVLPPILGGLLLASIIAALYLLGHFCLAKSTHINKIWTKIVSRVSPIYQRVRSILRALWKVYQLIAGVLYTVMILSLALVYGIYYYAQSPRMVGGGEPASVILIFKDPTIVPSLGLPFSMNATYSAQSEPVELLMELTDGVLVRQSTNGIPVIIRDDLLYGIMDVPAATTFPTATATAIVNTPASIPKSTQTPISAPTPIP